MAYLIRRSPRPARYVMKQKLFSWGDDFTIQDAEGRVTVDKTYTVDVPAIQAAQHTFCR